MKKYEKPLYNTEKVFDIEAGGISLFARCWGLTSPINGNYTHPAGTYCKE